VSSGHSEFFQWNPMFADCRRFDYRNNYLSTEGDVFRGIIRR
jgi:mannosyl-oligosaccharide alpha-1,2-mannosidase